MPGTPQAAGVAVLAWVFVPQFGWGEGMWHAVFHTISAFNNAGFALFPDSLSSWATDPLLNGVVPLMFILVLPVIIAVFFVVRMIRKSVEGE